jgi:hypothetical protein
VLNLDYWLLSANRNLDQVNSLDRIEDFYGFLELDRLPAQPQAQSNAFTLLTFETRSVKPLFENYDLRLANRSEVLLLIQARFEPEPSSWAYIANQIAELVITKLAVNPNIISQPNLASKLPRGLNVDS